MDEGDIAGGGDRLLPDIHVRNSDSRGAPGAGWEKSVPELRYDGIIRHLKNELLATKNKAEADLRRRDVELDALRKLLEEQRELVGKQKETIKSLQRALKDYQVTDSHQQRSIARHSNSSDALTRSLRNQIRDMELTHERTLQTAQEALDRAKAERTALALGLAAIAQQALGGNEASSEELAADLEAAITEGGEPLPRNPSVWVQLKYELDDRGNLASFSHTPGSFLRPFDRDGARAIAALCAQVGRLHKQRAQFRARGREALEQMGRVQAVLDNIDIDFSVVNEVVNLMAAEAEGVVAACGLPPIMPDGPPPVAAAGRVSDRLGVVWQLLGGLCGELLTCRGPQTLHMDSDPVSRRAAALEEYRATVREVTGMEALGDYEETLGRLRAEFEALAAVSQPPLQPPASPQAAARVRSTSPPRTRGRSTNGRPPQASTMPLHLVPVVHAPPQPRQLTPLTPVSLPTQPPRDPRLSSAPLPPPAAALKPPISPFPVLHARAPAKEKSSDSGAEGPSRAGGRVKPVVAEGRGKEEEERARAKAEAKARAKEEKARQKQKEELRAWKEAKEKEAREKEVREREEAARAKAAAAAAAKERSAKQPAAATKEGPPAAAAAPAPVPGAADAVAPATKQPAAAEPEPGPPHATMPPAGPLPSTAPPAAEPEPAPAHEPTPEPEPEPAAGEPQPPASTVEAPAEADEPTAPTEDGPAAAEPPAVLPAVPEEVHGEPPTDEQGNDELIAAKPDAPPSEQAAAAAEAAAEDSAESGDTAEGSTDAEPALEADGAEPAAAVDEGVAEQGDGVDGSSAQPVGGAPAHEAGVAADGQAGTGAGEGAGEAAAAATAVAGDESAPVSAPAPAGDAPGAGDGAAEGAAAALAGGGDDVQEQPGTSLQSPGALTEVSLAGGLGAQYSIGDEGDVSATGAASAADVGAEGGAGVMGDTASVGDSGAAGAGEAEGGSPPAADDAAAGPAVNETAATEEQVEGPGASAAGVQGAAEQGDALGAVSLAAVASGSSMGADDAEFEELQGED